MLQAYQATNTDSLQCYLDSQNFDAGEGVQPSKNDPILAVYTALASDRGLVVNGAPKKKKPNPLATDNREIFKARFASSGQRYKIGIKNPIDIYKKVDRQMYELTAQEKACKLKV